MKHRVLWVVLAGSLAFNLFFLVGLLSTAGGPPRPAREEVFDAFADRLGLDADQRAALEKLREDMAAGAEERREAWRKQFDAFLGEIVKDRPEAGVIEAYIAAAPGPEQRRRSVERILGFMRVLRPEQRRKAVDIIRRTFEARMQVRRPR